MSAPARLRTLVVDDETLARDAVRLLLADHEDVELVGECANGSEAVDRLRRGGIDLVFLDVQMPGMTGFDVVRAIGVSRMPATIFVTAYDEHALEAFEVEALDYLLKPVDDERFHTAITRVRRRLAQEDAEDAARRLASLLAATAAEPAPEPCWLTLKTPGRVVRLREQDIDWIEAADYCVRIHAGDQAHVVRATMTAMERTLRSGRFVRIHRSTIVNADRVREVQPLYHGDFLAILDTGARLRVSRTRRRALEAAFGSSF
ncbi:MAG: LytR/AlgR family response regulator transcription factor [Planctomycetota bacterium]|jgi:two-component system LytT family response regulator